MSFKDRKSTRAESDQFISYRAYDSNNRVCDEGMAKTRDISRTGVSVENRRALEVGAKVELTIALIEDVIKTESVVRNVKKADEQTYYIGLEFTKISDEELEKLGKEFPNLIE
jgi:c-di-GMP-binding flagellar brake protein YcgR